MAQGSVKVFDEAIELLAEGWNMGSDSFKVALLSTQYGSVAVSTATPTVSDFTECSAGGGYTTGGEAATVTSSEASGTYTFRLNASITWTSAGSGDPTDVRTAVVVNDTDASDTLVCAIDMTTDGTTALDMTSGDITINAGDLFTIS